MQDVDGDCWRASQLVRLSMLHQGQSRIVLRTGRGGNLTGWISCCRCRVDPRSLSHRAGAQVSNLNRSQSNGNWPLEAMFLGKKLQLGGGTDVPGALTGSQAHRALSGGGVSHVTEPAMGCPPRARRLRPVPRSTIAAGRAAGRTARERQFRGRRDVPAGPSTPTLLLVFSPPAVSMFRAGFAESAVGAEAPRGCPGMGHPWSGGPGH